MERIYLDNAATTKIDPQVLEAMLPYLANLYGNASSTHEEGRKARLAVETARQKTAQLLGAHHREIYFTSGGTESNNIALRSAVRDLGVTHIITSKLEHHAVLNTIMDLQKREKIVVSYVVLKVDGSIDLNDLERLVKHSDGKLMVSLMHANNEIGNILDIDEVADICHTFGAIFHSDTVQTVGHYYFDLKRTKVDLLSASSHKFHGPKGTGILYASTGLGIKSITTGGSQENGIRAGTENVAGIVGFAKALELATERMVADRTHISKLKNQLINELAKLDVKINGAKGDKSLYTVVNAAIPSDRQTETLLLDLDIAGIAASGGSACSAGKGGSHVIGAIGKEKYNNIRFSFSRFNTLEEINAVGKVLQQYFDKLYAL